MARHKVTSNTLPRTRRVTLTAVPHERGTRLVYKKPAKEFLTRKRIVTGLISLAALACLIPVGFGLKHRSDVQRTDAYKIAQKALSETKTLVIGGQLKGQDIHLVDQIACNNVQYSRLKAAYSCEITDPTDPNGVKKYTVWGSERLLAKSGSSPVWGEVQLVSEREDDLLRKNAPTYRTTQQMSDQELLEGARSSSAMSRLAPKPL